MRVSDASCNMEPETETTETETASKRRPSGWDGAQLPYLRGLVGPGRRSWVYVTQPVLELS